MLLVELEEIALESSTASYEQKDVIAKLRTRYGGADELEMMSWWTNRVTERW